VQTDPIDIELIDRYLAGTATPDEAAIVDAWAAKRTENAQLVDTLRATEPTPPSDAQAVWSRIAARLAAAAATPKPELKLHRTSKPFASPPTRKRWLIASGVTIAAAASLLLVLKTREPATPTPPAAPKQYASTKGQRAELRLTDGTRVILAPDSRLIVPATFDSTDRTLELEGQAYFDVIHNDARPFSVKAGQAFIRDLGTRFDVRAFANEANVRVVVTHGKIQLGRSMAPIDSTRLVSAGQLSRLSNNEDNATTPQRIDTTRYVSWTRGVLVFDRTPVPEALAELARWYDVDIRVASDSLTHLTLTATLRDQSLTEVINVVALALHASAHRQGRIVTLRPL
jgi:transmembrane sensor